MTKASPGKASCQGGNTSWTNETLPLDLRRELLSQELERFTARRHPASGGGPDASRPAPRSQQAASDHPSATGGNAGHHE